MSEISAREPVRHGPYRPPFLFSDPAAASALAGDQKKEEPAEYGKGSAIAEMLGIKQLPIAGHVTGFDRMHR